MPLSWSNTEVRDVFHFFVSGGEELLTAICGLQRGGRVGDGETGCGDEVDVRHAQLFAHPIQQQIIEILQTTKENV